MQIHIATNFQNAVNDQNALLSMPIQVRITWPFLSLQIYHNLLICLLVHGFCWRMLSVSFSELIVGTSIVMSYEAGKMAVKLNIGATANTIGVTFKLGRLCSTNILSLITYVLIFNKFDCLSIKRREWEWRV